VRFLGWIPAERLAAYYAHALALVVPSVGFETFGIVVIEAFQHGTPVIARRAGTFPEILGQAGTGLLFDGADELRAALRRLQSDPALRARMRREGYDAYVRHWSESAVVPRYLEIIENCPRSAALRDGRRRAK
jgi:glycosyltransferase involved in cell wall biosynthesis